MRRAPFGTWPSPLSPDALATGRVSLAGPQVSGSACWWSESRPAEGGRQVVMRAAPGGAAQEVTPPGASARSRVHEYGGAAFRAEGATLFYTSYDDQALWRIDPARPASRLTPDAPRGEAHRYADVRVTGEGRWLVAVRERHARSAVVDELVTLDATGASDPVVLVDGHDFFAAPRPSGDGRLLAWLAWDHPRMPWDGTELWTGTLERDEAHGEVRVGERRLVAGGPEESVGQPTWAPDGSLWFVSDRYGFWQPFRVEDGTGPVRMCAEEAEFHAPDWVLGQTTLDFSEDGSLVCRFRRHGRDHVGELDPITGVLTVIDQPYVAIVGLQVLGDEVVVAGSTERDPPAVGRVGLRASRRGAVIRRPARRVVPASCVSVSEPMVFDTSGGQRAHLLFYPPVGDGLEGLVGTLPPLVVMCHGGPTAGIDAAFDPVVQLWTSRGVAVATVDYRGSAGHGRAYRRLLDGLWGVADAQDCAAAAAHLASTGRVDGDRMVVKGSSAGGLTALVALVPGGPFAAAVVAYPVTDLRALAQDTHKFESHYLDRLVGPWPQSAGVYEERSPALHPERIGGAVLLLQGADDPVVPPDQASRLADALRARGVRCDHVVFEGEGHGFRRADTLEAAARLELEFVGEVLEFQPVL